MKPSKASEAYHKKMRGMAQRLWHEYFIPKVRKPHTGYNFRVQIPASEVPSNFTPLDLWNLSAHLEVVAREHNQTIYSSSCVGGAISPKLETGLLAAGKLCFDVRSGKKSMGY